MSGTTFFKLYFPDFGYRSRNLPADDYIRFCCISVCFLNEDFTFNILCITCFPEVFVFFVTLGK
jgi:hypothetical protein